MFSCVWLLFVSGFWNGFWIFILSFGFYYLWVWLMPLKITWTINLCIYLHQGSKGLSVFMSQMIYYCRIKILIAHPPVSMQLNCDPGVFVPDESYPTAWYCDYDVESHSVDWIKQIFLQSPVLKMTSGHLHVAQCQSDNALFGQHRSSWLQDTFNACPDFDVSSWFAYHKIQWMIKVCQLTK